MNPPTDFNNLLPRHYIDSDVSKADETVMTSLQNEYDTIKKYVDELTVLRSAFLAPESALPLIAQMLGVPMFFSFPNENRRQLISSFPFVRSFKGTAQAMQVYAALMKPKPQDNVVIGGYEIEIVPQFCAYAYPNISNPLDSINDPYFNQEIGYLYGDVTSVVGYPVDANGIPVQAVVDFKKQNYTLSVVNDIPQASNVLKLDGVPSTSLANSVASINNNDSIGQKYMLALEGVVGLFSPYRASIATDNSSITLYLKSNIPVKVKSASKACLFLPGVVYASSYYDVYLYAPPGKDYANIQAALIRDFQVIASVGPSRATLRRVRPFYKSREQSSFVWTDTSGLGNNAYRLC